MIDTREIATAKIVMLGGNGGGGGTSNYNQLTNKPSINGVTLQGNKTSSDLHIDGMPENPLATSHGGTGNADGYIRKGVAQGSTVGNGATAEGYGNTASGDYSHAEGSGNTASSYHAHAEGSTNTASAPQAHAEGYGTTASGAHSHAGGAYTVAGYANQTALGEYNDNKATTLLEVGNGTADNARSNAFEVHSNGNIVAGGTVSDANGTINAVVANSPDAPTSLLNKLKIGSTTYDATAVKPYTASSITSGTTGVIRVNTISTNSIDGDLIAITTGSNSGTTTNAWALTFYDGGTLSPLELKKADGTGYTDAITENQLLFVIPDLSNSYATVVGVAGVSGGGASALTDLTDTNITSPTDGQVLTYNGTTGKWGNQNPSGGVAESVVGPVENGTTASQAYAVGEHFIRNDKFCTAIAAIASGATLTLNTNYVEGTIAENLAYGNYSLSETFTGKYWINGAKIYRKVIDFGYGPNNSNKEVNTELLNSINCIKIGGIATSSSGTVIPVPYVAPMDHSYDVGIYLYNKNGYKTISLYSPQNHSGDYFYIIIEYTKNS